MSNQPALMIGLLPLALAGCIYSQSLPTEAQSALSISPIPGRDTAVGRTPTPSSSPTPTPEMATTEAHNPIDYAGLSTNPAPDPFDGLRIDDLAAREYGGPGIVLEAAIKSERDFVQYTMSYESDGLTITGLVDIPRGNGPFPLIIVNHGYLRPGEYKSGFDSWRVADWLAQHGYIAIMPDYRNYAGSDKGPNFFWIGYAIDVMNLIAQVNTLPQAIPGQIGVLGHSMGGGISMWPMVLSDEVDAVVLYASMSGDIARNWEHARRYWPEYRDVMDAAALIYGTPTENPQGYAAISPVNYLDRVQMPVMIHHGTHDEAIPYWWSDELWKQMQTAGIDVTFWPYPGATHGFGGRGFETFMQRNLAFFDEYVRQDTNTP